MTTSTNATEDILSRIDEHAERFAEEAQENERIGRLSDESVRLLRDVAVIRLLQPPEYGGYGAHPRTFAEAVMAISAQDGSAGWVGGVLGTHPWELAICDPLLRAEIWDEDPDVWVGSPYAAHGVARPVDGGFVLSGHWPFSSGTDHCSWVVLGATTEEGDRADGPGPRTMHMALPRKDYRVVDDSWNVVGLKGTGSKDVVVDETFVPEYRTIDVASAAAGRAAAELGRTEPLYRMPYWMMVSLAPTAAVIGMAEGALAVYLGSLRSRVVGSAAKIKDEPYVLHDLAEAASEIAASRTQLLTNIGEVYAMVERGEDIPFVRRAAGRRDQIRAAWRAVAAVDEIFARAGGNALRLDRPLQRFWRDAHAGLNHAIHATGTAYHAATFASMGIDPPETLCSMI